MHSRNNKPVSLCPLVLYSRSDFHLNQGVMCLWYAGEKPVFFGKAALEILPLSGFSNTDKSLGLLAPALLYSDSWTLSISLVLDEPFFFFWQPAPICLTYPISSGCLFDLRPSLFSEVRRGPPLGARLLFAFSFSAIAGAASQEWHASPHTTPRLVPLFSRFFSKSWQLNSTSTQL